MDMKDPVSVYAAMTNAEAQALAQTLKQAGITAHLREDESATGFPMGGTTAPMESIQVWVDQTDAERAAEIVDEFEKTRPEREPEMTPGNPEQTFVTAVCEECGESTQFAGTMLSTVQDCPHCGKFMDVGAPPDDFDPGEPLDEEVAETDEES